MDGHTVVILREEEGLLSETDCTLNNYEPFDVVIVEINEVYGS